MAQPVNFNIIISPWPLVAAVFISQIIFKDRLMDLVGNRFNNIIDTVYAASKNVVLESPVTVLAAGLTYAVHQLTPYAPVLALSTAGSMKAAAFVGGVFVLKSALAPALEKATEKETAKLLDSASSSKGKEKVPSQTLIRNALVLNFFPLAIGCVYAYYASVPVRLAQSSLYTAGLIGVVKLLGKVVESVCRMDEVNEKINNWYFGLDE